MLTKALTMLVIAWAIYELIEHIVFPLIWVFLNRGKKPSCGVEQMMGKEAEVRLWGSSSGYVMVEGERWKAICEARLTPGDRVVVQRVDGLTLTVAPVSEPH